VETSDVAQDNGTNGEQSLLWRWRLAVRDACGLTPNARLLALTLATWMDADGWCWPSVATLARAMGYRSTTSVHRGRRELVKRGFLETVRQDGRSNGWQAQIPTEGVSPVAPLAAVTGVRPAAPAPVADGTPPLSRAAPTPAAGGTRSRQGTRQANGTPNDPLPRDDARAASSRECDEADPALVELVDEIADADEHTLTTYAHHFGGRLDGADFEAAALRLARRRDDARHEPLRSEAAFVYCVLDERALYREPRDHTARYWLAKADASDPDSHACDVAEVGS
jgi:hypothetical protein